MIRIESLYIYDEMFECIYIQTLCVHVSERFGELAKVLTIER